MLSFFKKRLAVDLLKTFWEARNQPLTVNALMQASGWSAGDIYPALIALEDCGMLESQWVEGPKPRRRLYEMTDQGKALADSLVQKEAK